MKMRTKFGVASILQSIRDEVEKREAEVEVEVEDEDGNGETEKETRPRKRKRASGKKDDLVLEDGSSAPSALPVPRHLMKYYRQRHRLFSLYDHGISLDQEGWYSVTPEAIAAHIAQRCQASMQQGRPWRVLDAMVGVGGNAIQFAAAGASVVAIEKDGTRLECARGNAAVYEVEPYIDFIHDDWLSWAATRESASFDLVFLSPPWGGVDYQEEREEKYNVSRIQPTSLASQYRLAKRLARDGNVVIYLPRNTEPLEIACLDEGEDVEVEYLFHDHGLKAVAAYFGRLANYVQ